MILAGRRLNDNMSLYVAGEIVKLMTGKRIHVKGARILVLGLAFKENCPDLRNSKVIDIIRELEKYGAKVDVFDPWIDVREARHEYGVKPLRKLGKSKYDSVVLAVAHNQFRDMGIKAIRRLLKPASVIYDIKHLFGRRQVDGRL
jgi:UDP-N-acetyl-D-glucosamine/UDP-N-acetyl-D-galactosamine dehydrogenase